MVLGATMGKLNIAPATTRATDAISWFKEMESDKSARHGRLYAREAGGRTDLFVRSTGADLLMKLFSPEKRAQQKQLAHGLIHKALVEAYPGVPADRLLTMVGIAPNAGIRVKSLGAIESSARKLINAQVSEDVTMALRYGMVNLQGWKLADSPELHSFLTLKGRDLALWSSHRKAGTGGGLLPFQELLREAVGRLPADPGGHADKKAAVIKFLSTWTHLSTADKRELRDKLSAEGRAAMAAVDAIVPKLIDAMHLPLAPAGEFGLDDKLATDTGVRDSLANIATTIVARMDKSAGVARDGMTQAADRLASELTPTVREHLGQLGPATLVAPSHALKQCVRAFVDQQLDPATAALTHDDKNKAILFWTLHKEAFIDRVCSGIQHGLLTSATISSDGVLSLANARCWMDRRLGEGAEGKVDLAHLGAPDGTPVAVKTLAPREAVGRNYALHASPREAMLHQLAASTNSPHVVGFVGAGAAADGSVMLAMEFAPNGSLADVISGLHARQQNGESLPMPALCRHVLRSMASGLKSLHDAGLRHRDIKGGNVYLGEGGVLKIGDFGRSILASEDISAERPNDTPDWLAPEFGVDDVAHTSGAVQYTTGADLWAAGIVMLELATGKPSPFKYARASEGMAALAAFRTNPDHLDPTRRRQALGLDTLYQQDPELADLLVDMLHPRASARPSAEAVLARLPADANNDAMGELLIKLSAAGRQAM